MSCFHPLKAFQYSDKSIKFLNSYSDLSLWNLLNSDPLNSYPRPLSLPCGKCIGCRLDYSHNWAVRCLLEARTSKPESCYFVTLTYDDDHISDDMRSVACDSATGEVSFPTLTLVKKDLQDFMKRLRYYCLSRYGIDNLRFFASGEYGTKSMRPHFHLILFNYTVPSTDKHLLRTVSKSGLPMFESDCILDSWGKGFAPVGYI